MSFGASIFWNLFLMIAFIAGVAYYIYILAESRVRLYHEKLARTQTAYLMTQLEALQDLREKEADVQKMRHDLKKHLAVIETLCREENYEEVRAYSSELSSVALTASKPLSGNKIADTILAARIKEAQANQIAFTFEGDLSGLAALSPPDICSLLANAYDNAMEACLSKVDAFIHTKANTTKNYVSIEIRNSIPKRLKIHRNQLATTKADKYNHGYGIDIMKQIAQKYRGDCTISSTESEFILRISLLVASTSFSMNK